MFISILLISALRFEFAPLLDVTPRIETNTTISTTIRIKKGAALPPVCERKCTVTENYACTNDCGRINQGVVNCTVKTMENKLTRKCTCGNMGLYTELDNESLTCEEVL